MSDHTELQELLCEQWCSEVAVAEDKVGIRLSLPILEDDGDSLTVWIQPTLGGWTIRDCGTTMMRMSYDIDVDLLTEGQRGKVLERILSEHNVRLLDGELLCDVPESELGAALLRFGHAAQRIGDIKLWSRTRVISTFYDDLRTRLTTIVGPDRLLQNYAPPNVPDSESYIVDFAVLGAHRPLYIFGVPSSDKAKLTTIVLLHLQQAHHIFDSLVIPSDIESIGKPDLRRLMNAANDFVDSSSAVETIERKIRLRLA